MRTIEKTLSHLILGQKGGQNRIQIIELIRERPYNVNQLAEILNLNYRTIKYHMNVLLKNELVSSSKTGGYGEVYLLTPEMEDNMVIFEDIKMKFEKSKKLKDFTTSPKFFQDVMEQTNDTVIIINEEKQVFFLNKSAEKLLGYNKNEIIGAPFENLLDSSAREELINKISAGEHIVDFETKFKAKSGKIIDINLTVDHIREENGIPIGFSILSRDITRRIQAEEALRENEERYRHLFEDSPIGIGLADFQGKIITANSAMEVITGYSLNELKKINLNDLYKDQENRKALIDIISKNGKAVNYPARLYNKDGNIFDALLNTSRIRIGEQDYIQTMCIDITERKRTEEALKLSEERYALAQRAANIGSWDWNIQTGDLKWSETIEPMFGFDRGEFGATYEAFLDRVHPEDRQFVMDSVDACIEEGKEYTIEHRIVWPDGTIRWVSESGDVIRDRKKEAIRMLGIVRDITEQKLMITCLHQQKHELDERVKELNCLYSISKLVEKPGITLEELIQETVELIPVSWQYPEITSARIVLNHEEFRTNNFKKTKWKQASDILFHEKKVGVVEVYYLEERPEREDGPFLKEERHLIEAIASRLGRIRERMMAQERIRHINGLLMAIKDIGQLISHESDLGTIAQGSCDRLLKTQGYLDVCISFLDSKKGVITPIGHSGNHPWSSSGIILDGNGNAPKCVKSVVNTATRNYISSTEKLCGECSFCKHGEDHKSLLIPMLNQRSVVGVLTICFQATHEIDKAEIQLLEEVASDLAFAHAKIIAERTLMESRERYHYLFEDSPISLWEEDFTDVKKYIDSLRGTGIKDFREYFKNHPEEVVNCVSSVRIIDVNKNTLVLYKAENKEQLLDNLNKVFDIDSYEVFREELIALAEGKTTFESEAVTRTLTGNKVHIRLRLAVAPGYEDTLGRVLISIIDIPEPNKT
ncbi:MAG: PAS domain S-box protein [Methanomassiliicoccales archaeon]|nr:MAG: PAS domain S-box protein [Methanomassiliicoccales archaeon]